MNGGDLGVILAVDAVGTLAWTVVLSLFVPWSLAWSIALGSFVYAAVLLSAIYQFAEVQDARGAAATADDLDSDGVDDAGVQ